MRLLLALIAPLLAFAQTPTITSLTAVSSITDKNNLLTVGGERLILGGSNFGSTGATLSYIGPSPYQNGFTIRYTPIIQSQNDTAIIFTTAPGAGANLQFSVTRQQNNATVSSLPLASYAPPVIYNITGVGSVDPYALKPQGGELLKITGRNFGPRTYPGYTTIYTPWVRYGGTPGTYFWMSACSRTATDFDSVISCRTTTGGGTNHSVRVNGGYTGQWSPVDRNKTVSFITPTVLSTTPTFSSMTTAGGDQIVIRGLNMPFPSWVILGFCPVSASFGPYNYTSLNGYDYSGADLPGMPLKLTNTSLPSVCAELCVKNKACKAWTLSTCSTGPTRNCWLKGAIPTLRPSACSATGKMADPPFQYRMTSCTGAFDGDGRTPVVTCLSPEGTGRGFVMSVNVGGLYTNLYTNRQIGYAPPVIYDFAGAATAADTLGNETVLINGRNFGRNASLIRANYTLNLKTPINMIDNHTYIAPACNVSIPHTQLACRTAPGVGQDLSWAVSVDNQDNVNPKTAYTTPKITAYEVRNATTRQLKMVGATTEGGDLLYIYGSGFGPNYLNLVTDINAISPFGLSVSMSNSTLVSDGLITIVLPPGGGHGWVASIKVADIANDPTEANYSYANPTVIGVSPSSGPTIGGTVITLFARDLAISNPSLLTAVLFGNPADGLPYPLLIPAALVPRPDNDTTTKSAFLPGRVTFRLPPGSGMNRYIRLVTYLNTDTPPDPTSLPLQNGVNFNYEDPQITNAVLSAPSNPLEIQNSLNFFGPDAVATNQVRLLTLYGRDFGQGTYPLAARDIQYLNGSWLNNTGVYRYDPTEWTDNLINLYTLQSVGNIKISLTSTDISGSLSTQFSNQFTYNDFSPTLLTNITGPFPTIGGSVATISAAYLSAAQSFNITVGSVPAAILDPITGSPLTTPVEIYTKIITNPACYSPAGPFTPTTIWSFQIRIPPGQGSQVATAITRQPDGSTSAPVYLTYVPPTITQVNSALYDPYKRYFSPTPGTQFNFGGSNFGPCPTITIATYTITSCTDQPGSVSPDHTLLTIQIPPGEGIGTELLGSAAGWTILITAGDQSAQSILFGWQPPEIIQLQFVNLPTIGGSQITIEGVNFGVSIPGYPQAGLPPSLQLQVLLNSTESTLASTVCLNSQRVSHNQIICQTPPAAGSMVVTVSVAGQVSQSSQTITYDPPFITSLMYNFTNALNSTILPGDTIILQGDNFGPSPQFSCVFFTNRYATRIPICNGQEDFAGEGEQPATMIQFWNHTHIYITIPQGTGAPLISTSVWGQQASASHLMIFYPPPKLFNITQQRGPAAGGYQVALLTQGIGSAPTGDPYPRAIPAIYFSPIRIYMNGLCLSSASIAGCLQSINTYTDTTAVFTMPEGIGTGYNFTVVIDDPYILIASNSLTLWSYDSPVIIQIAPNPVYVGNQRSPTVVLQGVNLGLPQAFVNFPSADRSLSVYIDSQLQQSPQRISNENLLAVSVILDGITLTAGSKQTDLVVAGQDGLLSNSSFSALKIYCEKDYFAHQDELCIACPVGGICLGSLTYPFAAAGFFNLNTSYSGAESCPASAIITNPDGQARDVCLVACSPLEACIGANLCAAGYKSAAPAYRCNVCDKGYYKRANECIRCPDSPIGVIIACLFVIMFLAAAGYLMNKYKVNLAFLSIAVDYFQVISIFLQTKIAWPPIIKSFMYVLSAFNLNLDIVAPECLVPDISYSQKFYFIQALPICLFGFLLLVNLIYIAYKGLILGRSKKDLMRHVGAIKAAAIVVMYFLYLYITRTLLDVFNCSPTTPPTYDANGVIIKYLSVQFEECGKPGGLQMRLMPVAILGLVFYSIGFPAFMIFTLVRHKLDIMFDQLLRAQEEGENRFENPVAYETRKAYGRLYYQYKPDFYFWSVMILGRKFCIAITTVLFANNSSFQMAACLLIMFISYVFQTRFNPFMCYSDFEQVIRDHLASVNWSRAHMQVNAMLLSVNAQNNNRKKAHFNNIVSLTGKINKGALFQAVGSWIFNYNTVEAIMLFCSVMICLMGIMYQIQNIASGYDNGGRDIITGVILFIMIGSILYLFTVLCIEIYLACVDNKTVKHVKLHAPSSRKLTISNASPNNNDADSKTEINPMMLNSRLSKQLNFDDFNEPPPPALWGLFKEMFRSNNETIKNLNETIVSLKRENQNRLHTNELEMTPVRMVKRELTQMLSNRSDLMPPH